MEVPESPKNKPHVIAILKNNYLDVSPRVFNITVSRKGVIFDLDGTLVDMEQANYRMYFEVLKKMYGLEISEVDWRNFFVGRRPQESIPDFLKSKGKERAVFNFERFQFLAGPIKDDFVFNHLDEVAFLLPGASHFLERLNKLEGTKLALATSTIDRFVKKILKHFDINNYFDVVLAGESVSRGKPDPEVYLKTLKALKLEPVTCLVLEDSQNGVEAALRAGIDVVRIENF